MGRYAARRFADLSPATLARIERAHAALFGDVDFTAREIADAEAELAAPVVSRQRSLDLAPFPESIQVRECAQASKVKPSG